MNMIMVDWLTRRETDDVLRAAGWNTPPGTAFSVRIASGGSTAIFCLARDRGGRTRVRYVMPRQGEDPGEWRAINGEFWRVVKSLGSPACAVSCGATRYTPPRRPTDPPKGYKYEKTIMDYEKHRNP